MLMSVSSSSTSRDSRIARPSTPLPASKMSSTGTSASTTTRLIIARIIDESSTMRIRISDLPYIPAAGVNPYPSVVHREVHRARDVAAGLLGADQHAVAPQHLFRRE